MQLLRSCAIFLLIVQSVNSFAQSNLPFSPEELYYKIKEDEIVDDSKEKEQKNGALSKLDIEDEEVVEDTGDRASRSVVEADRPLTTRTGNEMIDYFVSGKVKDRSEIKNGKRNGMRKIYYQAGTLQQEVPYLEGRIHGVARYYHDNGILAIETKYVMGKRQGNRTIYFKKYKDEREKIASVTPYKDDLIHGTVKKYRTSSDRYFLEYTAEFSKGNPEGKWITYENYYKISARDDRGRELTTRTTYIKQEENNVRGKKNGRDIIFRPDGSMIAVTMYKNNEPQFTDMYDSSGRKIYTNTFVNGKRNGLHKFYHDNEKLRSEVPFVSDLKHGRVRQYHRNGMLESTSEFYMDKQVGTYTEYYDNGKLLQVTNYGKPGIKWGKEMMYFIDGSVRVITEYDSTGMKLSETHFDKYSKKKYQSSTYKNNIQTESHYYKEDGELLWTNHHKGRRNVGIYRHYQLFGKLDVQAFIDEKENGYRYRYNEYNGTIMEKKYFLAGKIVPESEFLELFTIEDDIVKPK